MDKAAFRELPAVSRLSRRSRPGRLPPCRHRSRHRRPEQRWRNVDLLKFLIHFVGDVHQPFHAVGFELGGNGIRADGVWQPMNRHAAWDNALVRQAGRTPEAYTAYLEKDWMLSRDLNRLAGGTPTEWALASRVLGEAATGAAGERTRAVILRPVCAWSTSS